MNIREKIYKNVAKKLEKDEEVVEKVCNSVFEFLAETMRAETFEPYRIQGLGIFEVKDFIKYKKTISNLNKEKREQKNRDLFNNLKD